MAMLRSADSPLRILFRRLGTLALLIAVIGVFLSVHDVYRKERESAALRAEAEMQQADLSQQSAKLGADIASLKTDRGKEAALRQQYDVGKTGEGLIVIVEPKTPAPIQATSTLLEKLKKAFLWW